jgi:hypothetical protein
MEWELTTDLNIVSNILSTGQIIFVDLDRKENVPEVKYDTFDYGSSWELSTVRNPSEILTYVRLRVLFSVDSISISAQDSKPTLIRP